MKKLIPLILFAACTLSSFAQTIWSLRDCLDRAASHNLDIKEGTFGVKTAEVTLRQSKLDYLPAINANANYSLNTGRVLDPTTYTFIENRTVSTTGTSVGASLPIINGLQKYNTLQKSKSDLAAMQSSFEHIANTVGINISISYLEILLNKEMITTVQKQIESSKSNVERMRKLVAAGAATKGQALELEAQLAGEEYSLVNAENRLISSKIDICQLLSLEDPAQFDVVQPNFAEGDTLFAESVEEIYRMALNLPRISRLEHEVKSTEYDLKMAKGRLYPSLNFSAGYGTSYANSRKKPVIGPDGNPIVDPDGNIAMTDYKFGKQYRDNASSSLSVGLSVPILNGWSARSGVSRSKIATLRADVQLEREKQMLYKDVQKAYADVIGARKQFESARAKVLSNEETLKYTESRFNAGATTVTDYVMAKNNILISRAEMLQAKYNYLFKRLVLNYYKGNGIVLGGF